MSDLIEQILLNQTEVDNCINTMRECELETHTISWSNLVKIATAMELHKLKANEANEQPDTEALRLQNVVGSALDTEFLQALNDLIDRKLGNEPTKERF